MKQVITNFTFNTTAKTVTLSDFGVSHPVDLKRLYLITDVTTNQILYNFASSSIATATVSSNNVVTLSALPGGVANGDSLQIIYEVLSTDPTYETPLLPANASQETGGNLASINTNTGPLVVSSAGGYIRQDSTATIAKETGGNLATVATNTANTSSAGIYVRQDSTATLAKETGGNLAAIATNTGSAATSANQTNGSQLTKITDGTNTANVVAGDSGFNGVSTASATKTYTFTTSTTGAQTIGPYVCEGFIWVEIVYTSVGSGLALNGQFSPSSGGAYVTQTTFGNNTGAPSSALGASSGTIYFSPVHGNYFQINVTALTSGTFAGTVTFRSVAPPISTISATGTINTQFVAVNTTGTITTSSSSTTTSSNSGYGGFASVSVHGTYSGVSFGITESDDSGTTFYNVPIYDQNNERWLSPGATITPGTNVSNVYWVPIYGANSEVKVLASAYTSGTANVRISFSNTPNPGSTMSQLMDAAGNARGANVDANNAVLVDAGSATGSALPTGAFYHGLQARTSLPTAGSSGNLVGAYADKFGRAVVIPQTTRDLVKQQSTTITSSTASTTVVTALSGSQFADISSITLVNSSSTATLATLSDGTNSYYFYVPAGDMRGAAYQVPLAAASSATAWTVTCGTSVASLYVTVQYITNQ